MRLFRQFPGEVLASMKAQYRARLYRVPGLLAHARKKQIGLPVAYFFVLVQALSQFFKLPTCRSLNDGRTRRGQRLSGSLGTGAGLPTEDLLGHLGHALFGLH